MDYSEHNKKMMDYFGYLSEIVTKISKEEKINSISFTPLDNEPILRNYEFGRAYQIKKTENGLDIYYEPRELATNNRMIFIKDIPEKNIVKGDKCEINLISINGKLDVTIDKDNGSKISARVMATDCVYDTDYKFLHFGKVNTANKGYISGNGNVGYTHESHFAEDLNPIVYSVRYKGNLTKEIAIAAREQFEADKPWLLKLELEGKHSFLLLDRLPKNSKNESFEMDTYSSPRKFWPLRKNIVNTNNLKM